MGSMGGIGAGIGARGPSEDDDSVLLRPGEHDTVDDNEGKGRCP